MKIAIIGYGKMGKTIEKIAESRGHQIVARISSSDQDDWSIIDSKGCEVAIEFTEPKSALSNMKRCMNAFVPVVVGTTGWYEEMEDIENFTKANNGSVLWASNFSIGVNLFFKLNEYLATLMSSHSQYSPSVEEIHHIHKKDAPSGTAISIANGLIKNYPAKKKWSLDKGEKDDLIIKAIRKDEVPGTHSVNYDSIVDSIEIKHTAKNREGFALGSVVAAEWLKDKKGFFNMSDVL